MGKTRESKSNRGGTEIWKLFDTIIAADIAKVPASEIGFGFTILPAGGRARCVAPERG